MVPQLWLRANVRVAAKRMRRKPPPVLGAHRVAARGHVAAVELGESGEREGLVQRVASCACSVVAIAGCERADPEEETGRLRLLVPYLRGEGGDPKRS